VALPDNVETPRGLHLQAILSKVTAEELSSFPMLKKEDYIAVGGIVVLFSYIDFNLRRLVEIYDSAGLLQPPWKGKAKKLNMAEVAKATATMLPWPEQNLQAFERIEHFRGLRNLVAHFAIRRFPNEDAFVFMGQSAKDYKKYFGGEAPPGVSITAALDGSVLPGVIPELEGLQNWLARATSDIEKQVEHAFPNLKPLSMAGLL
jgi:hypothetical protein